MNIEEERARFEEWADRTTNYSFTVDLITGDYIYGSVQQSWLAWQASANASRPITLSPERSQIAAQLMAGMLANPAYANMITADLVRDSIISADALLTGLSKP